MKKQFHELESVHGRDPATEVCLVQNQSRVTRSLVGNLEAGITVLQTKGGQSL